MRLTFTHHWKRYEGIFVLSFLAITLGFRRLGITILNFCIELDNE